MRLSVVIPTLGGIQLADTIIALQNSSIRPMEILICMPNSCKLLADIDLIDNIKIIRTKKRGQVYQRSIGFIAAKGDYVMQLDDDFFLKNDAIEKLVRCLNSSDKKTAVAPAIFWNNTNISAFKRGRVSIAEKFSNWIVNGKFGYQPGVISLSGVGFGFYFNGNFQNKIQTEWLPGGCILHRMDNLVTENYFPFSGKAYSEDLIHSLLLKKNEVKLYICNNAIGFIEPIFYPDSLIELYKQYKATKYVVKIRDRGFARLHLFYFFRLIKTIVKLTFKEILRPVKKATK